MKLEGYTYKPVMNLVFNGREVDRLLECAHSHYDGKCRATARPRDARDHDETAGMLWRMLGSLIAHWMGVAGGADSPRKDSEEPKIDPENARVPTECLDLEITETLTTNQLDTLAKIAEAEHYAYKGDLCMNLVFELGKLVKAANREYERLNGGTSYAAVSHIYALHEGKTLRVKDCPDGAELHFDREDNKLRLTGLHAHGMTPGQALEKVLENPAGWEVLDLHIAWALP